MTTSIGSVFEEDGKLYPQIFFRWFFVWIKRINFFIVNFFLYRYIKMSESSDLTYYQRNWEVILNWAKYYHENDKERLKKQAINKYRNWRRKK